jgi:hypothetical protein
MIPDAGFAAMWNDLQNATADDQNRPVLAVAGPPKRFQIDARILYGSGRRLVLGERNDRPTRTNGRRAALSRQVSPDTPAMRVAR